MTHHCSVAVRHSPEDGVRAGEGWRSTDCPAVIVQGETVRQRVEVGVDVAAAAPCCPRQRERGDLLSLDERLIIRIGKFERRVDGDGVMLADRYSIAISHPPEDGVRACGGWRSTDGPGVILQGETGRERVEVGVDVAAAAPRCRRQRERRDLLATVKGLITGVGQC